ncbi:N-acetylglucosamine kinase [Streptomyces sp. NPDC099088]|uniref:N-acetylglucosamine kinase n=1 Tax=Streptomyces sp. NPDC099088 TaxID=3366101 RepID=UPI00380DF05B
MTAVLAVDLGKTGCRAAIWTDHSDEPLLLCERAGAPGLAGLGGAAAAETAVLAASRPILRQWHGTHLAAVSVGAAGAAAAPDAAEELARRLLAQLSADEVAVTSDAVTAHAGALGAQAGVVLAAGTGAVVVGIGDDRTFTRVDGWGPWLGDEGSGAWIGLAGLRAALHAHDGRAADTVLRKDATEAFGDLDRLPALLSNEENPARVAASFAPRVGLAAAAGDGAAGEIMHAAATALARSVVTAARPLAGQRSLPVAVTGGLFGLGEPLTGPFEALITSSNLPLHMVPPLGDPLAGARTLAFAGRLPHEASVKRVRHEAIAPSLSTG